MNSKRWVAALATGILCTTGLTSLAWAFQEAPMLTELVEAGSLPPVDEHDCQDIGRKYPTHCHAS